ncbi:MAG: UvrD-helicase domain-containing protein, partial [Opitutae bacterium]|nr:UvrD-helicase domain-containing protein [Opitutae bacterium]
MSNDTPSFDCAHTPLIKGVTLLEASAGTGKTYALARIVLRLVAEKGVEIGRVLTVTFTTAATDELRSRIRSLLAEALARIMQDEEIRDDETIESLRLKRDQRDSIIRRLRLAVTSFDEAVICTIHGFCNRALMENAFQTNSLFDAELHRDSKSLAVEAMEEFWRERIAVAHPVVAAAASTEKLKLETQAVFFDRLPKTEAYHLGFKLEAEDVESK